MPMTIWSMLLLMLGVKPAIKFSLLGGCAWPGQYVCVYSGHGGCVSMGACVACSLGCYQVGIYQGLLMG